MVSRKHAAAGQAASHLAVKRVYDPPAASDGTRVLVDRLWPRGLRKEKAGIDRWLRDVAPSTELRHWFGHDPKRWDGFRERYAAELRDHSDALDELRRLVRDGPVTLLFAAHDEEHNNAVALRDILGA
jgi:uncharacterized protein YeaO (DUF488 family)